jgi:hypothetical protein
MITNINKEIEAGIIFKNGTPTPAWIKFNNDKIKFKKVVYRWKEKKGEENIIKFTAMDNEKLYEISFNTKLLKCYLVAVDE